MWLFGFAGDGGFGLFLLREVLGLVGLLRWPRFRLRFQTIIALLAGEPLAVLGPLAIGIGRFGTF